MSDKLGAPGHAHEHYENLDAAYASVRQTRRANAISVLALAVAALSAVPAWLSYHNSSADLRQNRESLLLRDRIDTCIAVESAATDLWLQAGDALYAINALDLRGAGRLDELGKVTSAHSEMSNAMRAEYLGPEALARAEANLKSAGDRFRRAFFEATHDGMDRVTQGMDAERENLTARIREFHEACVQAVGSYRDGPVE